MTTLLVNLPPVAGPALVALSGPVGSVADAGASIQVGNETMRVVSGCGFSTLQVDRPAGATDHPAGATVTYTALSLQTGASVSATVTGPDNFGDSATAGAASTFSAGDHDHGLPVPTVRAAAGVPTGAPTGTELPIAVDTTALTGGVYYWDGAAWNKGASI